VSVFVGCGGDGAKPGVLGDGGGDVPRLDGRDVGSDRGGDVGDHQGDADVVEADVPGEDGPEIDVVDGVDVAGDQGQDVGDDVGDDVAGEVPLDTTPLPDGPGCTSTCTAAELGSYCPEPKTVAFCASPPGMPACYVTRGATACPGAKVCERVGSVASCVCPAVVATAAVGGGCASAGARLCAGNTVLVCGADAGGSGCLVWALADNCGALACDTAGGAAGCPCGAPAADAVYVDPVAGGGSSGRPATGAALPASCRFKTLTEGLAATGGARLRVVATAAASPVSFAAETFPLRLPAGVTVTTAAATPDPAAYKILFAGTSASGADAAVILGAGASLVGLSLENGGGNPQAVAVACTTGAVTLRGVRLAGTGGGSTMRLGLAVGSDAADPCQLAAQDLVVDGFDVGARVYRKLTATNLVVRNSVHIGVYIPATAGTDPEVILTGGEVTSSGEAGIVQETGALAITGTNVHGNTQRGLEVEGADSSATLGPGTRLDGNRTGGLRVSGGATVVGTGISASGNTMSSGGINDGVRIESGSLTLHQATIENNEGRGLGMEGGTAIIDDGSVLRNNGRNSGASAIRYKQGDLTVGGATGAVVKISGSARHGVYVWTDGGSGTGKVTIERTELSANDGAGVWVDFLAAGAQGTFAMRSSLVFDNIIQGVRIERAPAAGATPGVLIEGSEIRNNGKTNGQEGPGLSIAAVGEVVATVTGTQIHDNRAAGVVVEQLTGTASLTLEGNDIYANNVGAELPVGGVSFETAATLTSFRNNKVHANNGHQVGFAAPPNGGAAWTLGSGACDLGSNRLYCYGAGQTAIRVSGATATTVNAAGTAFQNATPGPGTDWLVTGGAHTVNAAGACPPVACN
jgi:hypothetical protein